MTSEGSELIVYTGKDLTKARDIVSLEKAKYWDRDYIHQRLNTITNPEHKILFTFLWFTGVRITEAVLLPKEYIDFENFTITVRWQKREKKGGKWLRRVLPLHPQLRDLLMLYTAPMKGDQLVFPMTRQRAWTLCKRYFNGSPHQLRHSFAVNWLRGGGDIVILSRMLGHSSVTTTMEYLKIVPIDQGKELLKIQF